MYAVTRTYKGLGKQRREELADELEQELAAEARDTVGRQAFAVEDQGETVVSTTVYSDLQHAERASRRAPVHPDLKPETSVREIGRGRPDR